MTNLNKSERFRKVAERRVRAVLRYLRLVGNCGNRGNYAYTSEEVRKIFYEIDQAMRAAKAKFHFPKDKEFKL